MIGRNGPMSPNIKSPDASQLFTCVFLSVALLIVVYLCAEWQKTTDQRLKVIEIKLGISTEVKP